MTSIIKTDLTLTSGFGTCVKTPVVTIAVGLSALKAAMSEAVFTLELGLQALAISNAELYLQFQAWVNDGHTESLDIRSFKTLDGLREAYIKRSNKEKEIKVVEVEEQQ